MKHHTNKHLRRALALFMTVLMAMSCVSAGLSALAAIDGIPTRDTKDSFFTDATLYGAEKWDQTSDVASLTFNWNAYSGSIGYDPQPGTLTFTYPSHIYLNVGETLEAAGYMGHMTASYGEDEGDATDFRVMLSSATWGESTRAGFSPISSLISGYSHQGTVTEGTKLMTGSSSHYDFSNDGRGSDQIIGNKSGDNENFLADNESVVVWRSNIKLTSPGLTNFDEYVLLKGTAAKTGEVTFNPTTEQNFTIGAAQRYTAFAWHSDNGTRFNRYAMNGGSRPQTTPAENALSMTFTVYDKSELARLVAAIDNGSLTADATAIANARAILADREVTQAQIDAAAASIGDRMTLLVNEYESDYTGVSSSDLNVNGFTNINDPNGKVYHYWTETASTANGITEYAYGNVVWAPAAGDNNVNWSGSREMRGGYFRIAAPTATVLVYDGIHTAKSPILFQNKTGNNSISWEGSTNQTLYFDTYWHGYCDGGQSNDGVSNNDKNWPTSSTSGSNTGYISGTINVDNCWNSSHTSTYRSFWNTLVYHSTGNNIQTYVQGDYYETFNNGNVEISGKYRDRTDFPLALPGTVYVLRYDQIQSQLEAAIAKKAIVDDNSQNWMYTETSLKKVKATIAAIDAANPANFNYNSNVAQGVADCAAAIADAKYMLDNDGLTLVKKQGTVTFVSQTGETLAINGQPATYTKEYGETIVANEIPQLSNVYYRTDNAQWDYGTELSWSPALPATITVDEPEKIFQISDEQTVQTYTVNFYDEDGTTVLATADWQYGDYPVWGSDEAPTKAPDSNKHYSFDHWVDTAGAAFTLNGVLHKFEVADVANSSRSDLNKDPYLNYTAVYAGDDHTFGDTSYSWTGYTACTATRVCTAEGCGYSETASATITDGVDPTPTCSATGTKTYTATFDKDWAETQTKTETLAIDENAHVYSTTPTTVVAPTYNPETDTYSNGSETYNCQNDATHQKKIVTITSADYKKENGYKSVYDTIKAIPIADYTSEAQDALTALNTALDAISKNYTNSAEDQAELDEAVAALKVKVDNFVSTYLDSDGEGGYTPKDTATNDYTIQFVNTNNAVLASYTKKKGDTVEYNGTTPVCSDNTAQYTYAFTGWTPAISTVTGDATYTATYNMDEPSTNDYTITFVNYAGTTVDSKTAPYGSTPTAPANTAESTDDYYKYTYAWPTIASVTGDATYNETQSRTWNDAKQAIIDDAEDIVDNHSDEYDEDYIDAIQDQLGIINDDTKTDDEKQAAVDELNNLVSEDGKDANKLYIITWINAGEPATTKVKNGDIPTHDLPSKADDDLYTYSYAWNKEIVAATEATTYTAVETKNYKQSVLDTIQEAEDIITDANDDTTGNDYDPMYIETIQEKLDILDDTKEPIATDNEKKAAVDALDELLDAQNDNKMYTITFVTDGSPVTDITGALKGDEIALPETEKDGCHFEGWYTDEARETPVTLNEDGKYVVAGDATLYAKFTELSLDDDAVDNEIKEIIKNVVDADGNLLYGNCYTADSLNAYNTAKAAVVAFKGMAATEENLYNYNAALTALETAVSGLEVEHNYTHTEDTRVSYTAPSYNPVTGSYTDGEAVYECANDATHDTDTVIIKSADYQKEDGYQDVYDAIQTLPTDDELTDEIKNKINEIKEQLDEISKNYTEDDQDALDQKVNVLKDQLDDLLDEIFDGEGNIKEDALKKYAIKFFNEDGTTQIGETQSLVKGAAVTEPTDPTKADDTLYKYKFNGWDPTVAAVAGDQDYIATFTKDGYNETVQNLIDAAEDIIDNHSDEYDEDYIDDIQDALDVLDDTKEPIANDEEKQAAVDALGTLTSEETKNANKLYTITWVIDGESETTKVKYGATPTHADPTKEGYTFTGWTPAITAVTGDTTYTAVFTEVSAQPAYYAEYDAVFAKLETVPTNDKVTAELKAEAQDKLDHPLDRNLTADQQQIIDDEVAAIRAILDKIFEKDSNGNYTDDVKDGAAVKYTVVFHWLGATLTRTVVSGKGAKGPDLTRLYGVEGMEGGHFVFKRWVKDSEDSGIPADITNVTENMDVYAEYKQEAHTGAWIEHEATCTESSWAEIDCTLCGMHFTKKTDTSPELGHAWGDWVVVTAATCAHPGRQTRTCTRDASHTETAVIPQLAHTDANGDTICDVCGNPTENHQHTDVNGDGKCDTCGATTDAHVHNYQNGVCTGCGQTQDGSFRCNLCSVYEQYRHIPVAGWFLTAFHFFYHLICQITSWR